MSVRSVDKGKNQKYQWVGQCNETDPKVSETFENPKVLCS